MAEPMFQSGFPILSTTDLERSRRFYRDVLGGEVTYQFPAEGPPGYVALTIGSMRLGIGHAPRRRARRRWTTHLALDLRGRLRRGSTAVANRRRDGHGGAARPVVGRTDGPPARPGRQRGDRRGRRYLNRVAARCDVGFDTGRRPGQPDGACGPRAARHRRWPTASRSRVDLRRRRMRAAPSAIRERRPVVARRMANWEVGE